MGIGRREFLAAFGTILARLAVAPSAAAVRHDDLYLNRRFGIAFHCLPGWEFIRIDAMGEMQQGQLLATEDVAQHQAILESLDLPFVALSPTNDPHICVQMYLAGLPNENDIVHELLKVAFDRPDAVSPERAFSGPMRVIRNDWQMSRGLLRGFTVTQLPKECVVSHCRASEYTADYEFEHEQIDSPRCVTVRSIAIEHGLRYYLLRLIRDASSRYDFSTFVDGLCLM